MTPEILQLREKAAFHRAEADACYRQIAKLQGSQFGCVPACLVTVNGHDVRVSDRQFEVMEQLIAAEEKGVTVDRRKLCKELYSGRLPTMREDLQRLRRRLKPAGVGIEAIGHFEIRLNVIKG